MMGMLIMQWGNGVCGTDNLAFVCFDCGWSVAKAVNHTSCRYPHVARSTIQGDHR